ncbi:hypothetical protein VMCG_08435 [Cytospora schulzeri]|uniref:Uncharacterized protein n=1 Tax=Cytospora schulzeri TaxID=448051 RepID=A0A423VQQ8_9PEZI|nr:hypothetical protein VMCG_08435 [Valsa malicola]
MVYDWESHKDTLRNFYVYEKIPIEDIINHMRTHHNFTPSKRAYQAQFRRWDFPSKHQPALKNDQLVARVKELWERNLSQAEMLRILNEEDGFNIKSRELNRVRSKHRWLLRVPSDKKRDEAHPSPGGSVGGGDDDVDDDDDDDNGDGDELMAGEEEDNDDSPLATPDVPDLASNLMEERRRKMETESAERWVTKKRRRRTRQYAGMPADPPGPPRFPSETTLGESQVILGLDKATYVAVRERFQSICEAAGVVKKTVAGPEAWETAKQSLVGEFFQLQNVMWINNNNNNNNNNKDDNNNTNNNNNMDRKKLALDVICSDVTKRMRSGGDKELLLADAKNILSLNPQESREVRAAFYQILQADGFTSKLAMGADRWKELKQRWIDGSPMLQRILSRLHDRHNHEMKARAVEALARDVMKRLRDDQTRRKGVKRKRRRVASEDDDDAAAAAAAAAAAHGGGFEDTHPGMHVMGDDDDASGFASGMLVPAVANAGQHGHPHPPRILPDHRLIDPQMGLHVPMDSSQLGPSLLLDSGTQGPFVDPNQQYLTGPTPLAAAPSPFDPSPQSAAPPAVFQTVPATNTGTIPIYLRLDHESQPSIVFLTNHSVEALCQLAEQKVPGSRCVRVEGMLKMPDMEGGHYIPLQIQDDDQLSAYLAHGGPPTFNVRLVF